MMNNVAHRIVLSAFFLGTGFLLGCEERKGESAQEQKAEPPEQPTAEPEEELSPPHFVVSEDGISVRGLRVEGDKKSGLFKAPDLASLSRALSDEKNFIEDQELRVIVDRKARRGWVGAYFEELGRLGASRLTVVTETREEFPGQVPFLPPGEGSRLPSCTMIGQVTEHNGSALWQLEGGTAKERGPGLGGPDLSMAKEVFAKSYEKCASDTFVTDGENPKEWGFIYDMAAAAVSTEGAGVKQALLPVQPQTAGRPVKF